MKEVLQILVELSNSPEKCAPLLKDPLSACMLIRLLPASIRNVVVKFIMIQGNIPFTHFTQSMGIMEVTERNNLLRLIKSLGILQGRSREVWINTEFQQAVLSAPPLLLPSVHPFFHSQYENYDSMMSNGNLSYHSHFERLLMNMVKGDLSPDYAKLLQQADLLSSTLQVTSKGFQFLMAPRTSQLWTLLMLVLKTTQEYQAMLHFAHCREDVRYHVERLPAGLLPWLQKFGLVHILPQNTFLITDLAYHLLPRSINQNTTTTGDEEVKEGFIILETNYSLYAYTDNPLHISLLSLFLSLSPNHFPNLVLGRVTFESIRSALESGTTADQIITYLHTYAHPKARERYGLECSLPPNLADQIRLWEMERLRVYKSRKGVLWSGFLEEGQWQDVLKASEAIGAKLYANSAKRLLIVEPSLNDYLKSLISNNKR